MRMQSLRRAMGLGVRISVIIPALNEEVTIRQAIESAWRAGGAEVIVADGGSTDRTLEVAGQCACRVVQTGRGRARQQNAAARQAGGDTLLFLHADNRLAAGAVDQVSAVLEDPQAVGGAFRQQIAAVGLRFRLLERGNAWRAWWQVPFGDQGIFVRKDVFFAVGGFPEVQLMEDVLLARLLRRQGRLRLLPGPLYVDARRWQRHGVVRQTLRNWALLGALACGASPDKLATYYPRHDQG